MELFKNHKPLFSEECIIIYFLNHCLYFFSVGPPSASQPSRKNKCKDEPDVVGQPQQQQTTSQIKVRRVSGTTSNVTSTTTPVTVVTTPMVKSVTQVTKPINTISCTSTPTYQTEPMTVQLAVNAQGQPRILTTSKPASLPVSLITYLVLRKR